MFCSPAYEMLGAPTMAEAVSAHADIRTRGRFKSEGILRFFIPLSLTHHLCEREANLRERTVFLRKMLCLVNGERKKMGMVTFSWNYGEKWG